MPNITITFTHAINRSAQPGDTAYYTPTTYQGGSRQASLDYAGMTKMGPIVSITRTASGGSMVVDLAEVKFVNKSNSKIELFQIGTDIFESSK